MSKLQPGFNVLQKSLQNLKQNMVYSEETTIPPYIFLPSIQIMVTLFNQYKYLGIRLDCSLRVELSLKQLEKYLQVTIPFLYYNKDVTITTDRG